MVRQFETGATRDTDSGKLDYEAFFSVHVMKKYAEYMHKHRVQTDGSLREGDNWQKGFPIPVIQKSLVRHMFQAWEQWRTGKAVDHLGEPIDMDDVLCAIIFNASAYLHELNK
jgi:hypothetical protein